MPRTETAPMQANPSAAATSFRLDFRRGQSHRIGMKSLLSLLAVMLCATTLQAAIIHVDGDLSWKIKKPDCTFKLDGSIQNLSPTGSTSGTLKLVLWATLTPFPSRGNVIAEHTLGQLSGGYQINSFSKKEDVFVPDITGNYYFTIAILEYTTSGWLTRAYVATGKNRLDGGHFITGEKWTMPPSPIIPPPAKLYPSDTLVLTIKATERMNLITPGTQWKSEIKIGKQGKATLTVSGDDSKAEYTYSTTKAVLTSTKQPAGRLFIDPSNSSATATLQLFFQSANSGIYRNLNTSKDGGSTTWGTFRFN